MNKYVKLVVGIILFMTAIWGISLLYTQLSKQYGTNQELITESQETDESSEISEDNQETEEIQEMIDFTVFDSDENEIQLSSFVGKPIVINFWASWCSPCKNELPDFQEAYDKYGSEIEFVMINLTDGLRETMDIAKEFVLSKEYTFPVYYDVDQNAAQAYAVYSIPTTYFLDENGKIVAGAQGMIDLETIEKGIGMIK